MNPSVRVSVVIAAYNAEGFIGRAIESVLAQTYKDFEVIVVDDGSTDNTREVVGRYSDVRYLYQSNAGPSAARNRGVEEAAGTWVAFLDADDRFFPKKLEVLLRAAMEHGADFLYSSMRVGSSGVAKDFPAVPVVELWPKLRSENFIPASIMFMKIRVFQELGGFDVKLRGAEDWDLVLRLRAAGVKMCCVDEPLVEYFIHSVSLSHNIRIMLNSDIRLRKKRLQFDGLRGLEWILWWLRITCAIYFRAGIMARESGLWGYEILYLAASGAIYPLPDFMPVRFKALGVSCLRLVKS